MKPLVTVMIPTRHRVKKLLRTLDQLNASATSENYEVILMGDLDDQETMLIFNNIEGAKLIRTPRLGYTELDTGYYARMEREADGEFVWIAGDDMLVYGDWFGELSKVPRTGFIVQPEISQLRESVYPYAEGQAFPIFPRFCWKAFQDNFPKPFDTCGSNMLLANGWKTWFLKGVTMWHDRPTDAEIVRHRRGDCYKHTPDECLHKWTRQRRGGSPDIADSYEQIVVCELCGEER
jgi:hypothetical protein